MNYEAINALQCHLLTNGADIDDAFPFAPRSLGLVTTMAYESVFGETKIIKLIPYSCTIGGTYDECATLAKSPLMGLNEIGVSYWEVVTPPRTVTERSTEWEFKKSMYYTWQATYRLVWIVNRNLLGYDCCSIADLIIEEILRRLYVNGNHVSTDCLEGTQTACGGKFSRIEIIDFDFLGTESFQRIFGQYDMSMFKLYACKPFEFGAMDITVRLQKCKTDLISRFIMQTPIPC